jgi:hypothetical protein
LLRETVRDVAEAKIAPAAADVDANSRFPAEALSALTGAGLHAAHIPEAHGGEGADALATVIIIEEVARVCASSSLIPAVNKLGTVPLLLAGSEELKRKYLPPVARGEALFPYALSEASAESDAASMRTRAVRDGDHWVLNGTKMWISNAGVSRYYTVMAVTDPARGARGISAFVVEETDPGVSFGEPEKKLGIKGSPTRSVIFADARVPADRDHRCRRHRFQHGARRPGPHQDHHRGPGSRHRPGRPGLRGRLRQAARTIRPFDRRLPGRAVAARPLRVRLSRSRSGPGTVRSGSRSPIAAAPGCRSFALPAGMRKAAADCSSSRARDAVGMAAAAYRADSDLVRAVAGLISPISAVDRHIALPTDV